jgi:aldose 1-epimerase
MRCGDGALLPGGIDRLYNEAIPGDGWCCMGGTPEVLRLDAAGMAAGVVPEIGGSIAWLRWRGIDLMRPLTEADRAARNVLGAACFPMMPYANRIAGNEFSFDGRAWRFEANNPPERYNVHGTGWQRAWRVEEAGPTAVRLALEVDDGTYAYRAEQRFAVGDGALTVAIGLENRGARRAPFGFGLHPWFPREPDVVLRFRARDFYLEEPEHVAGDRITVPPELDFAAGRALPDRWRNNDYGGWDGRAEVAWPSRGVQLVMTAEPVFRHLMVYADPGRPFFCVEPQSNAAGAFNRAGGFEDPAEGIRVLDPGETMAGTVRFTAETIPVARAQSQVSD